MFCIIAGREFDVTNPVWLVFRWTRVQFWGKMHLKIQIALGYLISAIIAPQALHAIT